MEFTGTIKVVLPQQQGVSQKGTQWVRQDYVIESTSGQFISSIVFTIFGQERIAKLQAQGLQPGAVGTVSVDGRAREYNGRWYNDLQAWSWRPAQSSWQEQPAAPAQQGNAVIYPEASRATIQRQDELPF